MAWVGALATAYSAYENSKAKGKSGGASVPGVATDAWSSMGMFDTSGWQVTTGGGSISGSTATGGRQEATTEQRPIASMSPGIDGGSVAGAGGSQTQTLMLLGAGALVILIVAMARRRK